MTHIGEGRFVLQAGDLEGIQESLHTHHCGEVF